METLLGYMGYMAQITAMMYSSWDADFLKKELFDNISKIKEQFLKEKIDYTKLSVGDLGQLGFKLWDERKDMLIPMWLFRLLPDETPLYCPLTNDDLILRKDADDDSRFGCSAFALMELKQPFKEKD